MVNWELGEPELFTSSEGQGLALKGPWNGGGRLSSPHQARARSPTQGYRGVGSLSTGQSVAFAVIQEDLQVQGACKALKSDPHSLTYQNHDRRAIYCFPPLTLGLVQFNCLSD